MAGGEWGGEYQRGRPPAGRTRQSRFHARTEPALRTFVIAFADLLLFSCTCHDAVRHSLVPAREHTWWTQSPAEVGRLRCGLCIVHAVHSTRTRYNALPPSARLQSGPHSQCGWSTNGLLFYCTGSPAAINQQGVRVLWLTEHQCAKSPEGGRMSPVAAHMNQNMVIACL